MAGLLEGVPERVHRRCQVRQLLEVELAERFQLLQSFWCQPQPDHAVVGRVLPTDDESRALSAVDQANRAVVT